MRRGWEGTGSTLADGCGRVKLRIVEDADLAFVVLDREIQDTHAAAPLVMTPKEIEEILAAEVASILGLDEEKAPVDQPLDALGMDSMAFVELLVAIEQEFRVKLMRGDMSRDDLRSISALAARIARAL